LVELVEAKGIQAQIKFLSILKNIMIQSTVLYIIQ